MSKFKPPEVVEPEIPRIYYDGATQSYWIEDSRMNWMRINETAVKRELKEAGFDPKAENGANSAVDLAIRKIQKENNVMYAGGLAGYERGPTEMNGQHILVTSEATIIEPAEGEWPMLEGIISRMFGDLDVYFYGWLKMAYEGMYLRSRKPGQVLVLVGDRGCGKTFLQSFLIPEVLGQRSGNPYRYMTGETTFNADFFETEHLLIGDECSGTDMKSRLHFGKELKKIAAERMHSCHRKGATALTLSPYWRCTISLNPDGQNLLVLPPIGESLADKIIMLRVHKGKMPMPTRTTTDEEVFRDAIREELPGFLQWLLDIHIPEHVADDRFGIQGYQDAELMALLEEHSPEEKLWDILVHVLTAQKMKQWEGTTSELEEMLTLTSDAAKKLFTFSSACGMYMARLAEKLDGRVLRPRTRGYWAVHLEPGSRPTAPTT